jgi:hypothetical protein
MRYFSPVARSTRGSAPGVSSLVRIGELRRTVDVRLRVAAFFVLPVISSTHGSRARCIVPPDAV